MSNLTLTVELTRTDDRYASLRRSCGAGNHRMVRETATTRAEQHSECNTGELVPTSSFATFGDRRQQHRPHTQTRLSV